jgi:hypothetical protein
MLVGRGVKSLSGNWKRENNMVLVQLQGTVSGFSVDFCILCVTSIIKKIMPHLYG